MVRGAKQLLGGLIAVVLLAVVATSGAAAAQGAGAGLSAHGSVQQVYVLGAQAGERLTLLDSRGHTVATTVAGPLGGAIFRGVAPGAGYRVRPANGGGATNTDGDGFTGPIGATEHQDLRPADPEVRLRLPDHSRRDEAGD